MSRSKLWILFGDVITDVCLGIVTFISFAAIGVMLAWRG